MNGNTGNPSTLEAKLEIAIVGKRLTQLGFVLHLRREDSASLRRMMNYRYRYSIHARCSEPWGSHNTHSLTGASRPAEGLREPHVPRNLTAWMGEWVPY